MKLSPLPSDACQDLGLPYKYEVPAALGIRATGSDELGGFGRVNSREAAANLEQTRMGSESAASASDWLVVVVGGERFEVPKDRLCLDDGSMLAACVRSQEGAKCLRFDRDASRFRHVLNYLRNGTLWLDDVAMLKAVREEARFYQLQGLQALCDEQIKLAKARKEAKWRWIIGELRAQCYRCSSEAAKDFKPEQQFIFTTDADF